MPVVIVTGGAGYVGSHVAKALAAAGHLPVTVDDLTRGHLSAVQWGPLVEADILDAEALDATFRTHRPHAVIHCAALAEAAESVRKPDLYWRVNVTGTQRVVEAMAAHGVRLLIFSSSAAVYGTQGDVDETAPLAPVNPYGASKVAAEELIRSSANGSALTWLALRYFNAAGADADGAVGERHDPETHLVPLAIRAAMRGEVLPVYGSDYPTNDGTAVRDYVHVSDLADAHVRGLRLLTRGGGGGALNLGTEHGLSVRQVITAVEAQLGRTILTRALGRREGDAGVLIAKSDRAKAQIEWRPRHSDVQTIVRTAWQWQKHLDSEGAPARKANQ